jgi:hypothetical protein
LLSEKLSSVMGCLHNPKDISENCVVRRDVSSDSKNRIDPFFKCCVIRHVELWKLKPNLRSVLFFSKYFCRKIGSFNSKLVILTQNLCMKNNHSIVCFRKYIFALNRSEKVAKNKNNAHIRFHPWTHFLKQNFFFKKKRSHYAW